ncbi:alpha/beta fold hydrolase [Muricoccus vinaceus]|uniref:Alpha/beta fold hydrolase n=1 Tax=Muricoccus vinaceus TaxID=424704 RepID=A0ABV6INJ9_9PROT
MLALIDDHILHAALHGDEARSAVVLLHSLGTCGAAWAMQTQALARAHFVICPDFRGHGLSEISQRAVTVERLAEDVGAVLDHLGVEAFHLAGISLGGLVAQRLAGQRGSAVRSLTLLDSNVVSLNPPMWRDRAAQARAEGLDALADGIMERWMPAPERGTPGGRALRTMLGRTPPEGYAAACEALAMADCRADAAAIRAPATVAVGEFDQATPRTAAEALAGAIAGSVLRVIEGAAHIPLFGRAEVVTALLRETIARAGE